MIKCTDLAELSSPAGFADALLLVESVRADAVHAGVLGTELLLDVAAFASETSRALAVEVVHQIRTVGFQRARLFGAVVDVRLAVRSGPSGQTHALVAAEVQPVAVGTVLALAILARIDHLVAGGARKASPAQAVGRSHSRQILTDTSIRTAHSYTFIRAELAELAAVVLQTGAPKAAFGVLATGAIVAG